MTLLHFINKIFPVFNEYKAFKLDRTDRTSLQRGLGDVRFPAHRI